MHFLYQHSRPQPKNCLLHLAQKRGAQFQSSRIVSTQKLVLPSDAFQKFIHENFIMFSASANGKLTKEPSWFTFRVSVSGFLFFSLCSTLQSSICHKWTASCLSQCNTFYFHAQSISFYQIRLTDKWKWIRHCECMVHLVDRVDFIVICLK